MLIRPPPQRGTHMLVLALGLVLMLGVHVFASLRGPRGGLVARIGADPYRGLHSLLAALGLALIVWGFIRYRADAWDPIWAPPEHARDVTWALMWFAQVSLACVFTKGPGRIRGWLRHPLLASVTLWSLAHLVSNGDAGGMLLFGAFFVWSIYARLALERRGDRGAAPSAAFTRTDAIDLLIGTVLWAALALLHPYFAGVAAIDW
jgi:uncharacterized membrane protein